MYATQVSMPFSNNKAPTAFFNDGRVCDDDVKVSQATPDVKVMPVSQVVSSLVSTPRRSTFFLFIRHFFVCPQGNSTILVLDVSNDSSRGGAISHHVRHFACALYSMTCYQGISSEQSDAPSDKTATQVPGSSGTMRDEVRVTHLVCCRNYLTPFARDRQHKRTAVQTEPVLLLTNSRHRRRLWMSELRSCTKHCNMKD